MSGSSPFLRAETNPRPSPHEAVVGSNPARGHLRRKGQGGAWQILVDGHWISENVVHTWEVYQDNDGRLKETARVLRRHSGNVANDIKRYRQVMAQPRDIEPVLGHGSGPIEIRPITNGHKPDEPTARPDDEGVEPSDAALVPDPPSGPREAPDSSGQSGPATDEPTIDESRVALLFVQQLAERIDAIETRALKPPAWEEAVDQLVERVAELETRPTDEPALPSWKDDADRIIERLVAIEARTIPADLESRLIDVEHHAVEFGGEGMSELPTRTYKLGYRVGWMISALRLIQRVSTITVASEIAREALDPPDPPEAPSW